MDYQGKIEDMDDLTEAAIEIDDGLHRRTIEKHGSGYAGRTAWGDPRGNRNTWGNGRGDPIELDVLEPQGRGTGRSSPRKCYTYGKPGHIARNCRSKNQMQRSQLNVLYELLRIRINNLPKEEEDKITK